MALRTMQKLAASGALLYLFAFFWAITPDRANAQESKTIENIKIHNASDFQKLGEIMHEKGQALLLAITAEDCPYCQQLESDFLRPMILSGEYKKKIIIRHLQIDLDDNVIDFKGNLVKASEFANRYQAYLTPTMIFIDGNGKEVADKIIGINTPQLFGAYIDIEIDKAFAAVREK